MEYPTGLTSGEVYILAKEVSGHKPGTRVIFKFGTPGWAVVSPVEFKYDENLHSTYFKLTGTINVKQEDLIKEEQCGSSNKTL
jgi:hypothetical protein